VPDVVRIASVTGVDLNLRVAGPGARSFAFIIDWNIRMLAALAWFAVGSLITFGTLELSDDPGTSFVLVVVLPAIAIYFLYHPVIELIMAGRTPGKRIAGIRIVKTDGAIPGFGAILIRNVLRLIDSLPTAYCVGLVVTVFTEHSVRIGDIAAGTLLVYDEPEDKALERISVAAIGRLGMRQLELLRDLLDRWDQLNPATRKDLARRLLASLGEETAAAADADADLRVALEAALTSAEAH
jgi:uncharacterized RDD family membrane protein YckC